MPGSECSPVWVFFRHDHMVEGRGTCVCKFPKEDGSICNELVRTSGYSTSPLRSHLNLRHPGWREKAEQNIDQVRPETKFEGAVRPESDSQFPPSDAGAAFEPLYQDAFADFSPAAPKPTKRKRSSASHTKDVSHLPGDIQSHLISNLAQEGIPLSVLGKSHWQDFLAKLSSKKSRKGNHSANESKQFFASAESAASEEAMTGTRVKNVILGVTGSVASVKCHELAHSLGCFANVKIITTYRSKHFLDISPSYDQESYKQFREMEQSGKISVYSDEDEWREYHDVHKDPVLHIEMRKWADLMIIAPASANTIAKMATGQCDNLLTSVVRAWDFNARKPILLAPAMNTHMWEHPFTRKHLRTLQKDLQMEIINPMDKILACGDQGSGAMASVDEITESVQRTLSSST
eukprot:gb/GECG01015301.1/.p1 GENE.gb/GECG01015301.1/~~gb/GECG01015301.1/.p1  ORF type:complete len:406 (+),score=48.45 gb/GECG01015301.1/:1-1218(+)